MDIQQQGMITLLKSGLTGKKFVLSQDFNLDQACDHILRNQIAPLIYEGALTCGFSKDLPVMQTLFDRYCFYVAQNDRQLKALQKIYKTFDENRIDYMPLKGSHVKQLYPMPELRPMGDADILIRYEQYEKIKALLHKLGFAEKTESDHELIWKSSQLVLELHKRPIPSYNKDYYSYFGDGWHFSKLQSGTRYQMRPEDEFVYIFVHFAKHLRDGGIDSLHVADLWVYRQAYPDLDEDYIMKAMDQLHLAEFYQNILTLLSAWFDDGVQTEKVLFITSYIFESGACGLKEQHMLSEGVKKYSEAGSIKGVRRQRFLQMVFPDAETMSARYPVLIRHPWLKPAFWPVRWISALLFRRDNIEIEKEKLRVFSVENLEKHRDMLHYIGLDYNF